MSTRVRQIVEIDNDTFYAATLAAEARPDNEFILTMRQGDTAAKMTVAVENLREWHEAVGDLLDFYDTEEGDDD